MKLGKSIAAFILLLSLAASGAAWARDGGGHGGGKHFGGGHFRGGHDGGRHFRGRHFDGRHFRAHPNFRFFIGPIWPFYYDPYYPNYYYPPPATTVPVLPPGYWYYCDNPPGYYPYIQQCFSGWRQVLP